MKIEDVFECPQCHSNKLEEVDKPYSQHMEINGLSDDGYIDYGEITYYPLDEDGYSIFQCAECGKFICSLEHELLEYLQHHWLCKQFEFENCSECGRGANNHKVEVVLGNFFARCIKI